MSAGATGPLAVGLVTALVTGVYATRLVRLALAIHGSRHSYGPCRGAGFLGMGVLASGVTATAAGLTSDATIAAGGLGLAIALYLLGLLLLPGAAGTVTTRLRRLLDGTGSGICLLFTAWLLVVSPHGGLRPLPLAVALGTCAAVAVAVVTGLRAARYRPAALACAGGAGLSIVGLATVAIVLGTEIPDGSAWLATVPLVAGPVLADLGARRAGAGPDEPDPADEDGSLAGYPLLALPVGLAVLAAAYHLLVVGMLDRISTVLGIAGVAAIGLREALAAVDVRRYARRLTAQEAHFRSLVSGATEVTVVVDAELVVRWQSPAAARHFGLSDQDVVGRPFTALVHPDDVARVRAALRASEPTLIEARLRDGFGRWRDTESTVSDLRDAPEVAALVVHVRDVGERKELERTLHRMAFTDQLTGLANRRELLRAVAAARLTGTGRGAVLVIDLDGLAGINDLRGHEVGDAVLIEVARRLRACVGDEGLPARVGGAEFAVLTARGPVFANTLADRLLTALGEPYRPPGATVHLSVSVGLAGLSGVDSVDDVLRRADLALGRTRQTGRGRAEWYDESMEATLARRTALERELPGVVERGELDLAYQLVLDLTYRNPVGVEALLRWRHPRLGTVPPVETVAAAEALGLTDQIAEWVLHKACRQLCGWLREGWDLWLSVNVGAGQLATPAYVDAVHRALGTHLVAPSRLLVEVGDPAPLSLLGQLEALRALGVRTALDRFGAGPTALADLRLLPVDVLKLDRALFTEPAGRTGPAAPILDVVVGLGDRLGVDVIASGLEDEGHLAAVRAAGCRYGQGYLFHRPAPGEHVEAYLEQHRTRYL